LITIFFLGGWSGPMAASWPILGVVYFFTKTFLVYLVISWIRLSLPRIRIDEMLDLNWKFMIPVSFLNLVVVAVADRILMDLNLARWIYVGVMFALSMGVLLISLAIAGNSKPKVERVQFPTRPVAVSPQSDQSKS